eukprot:5162329-Amphidinium_carterae.1
MLCFLEYTLPPPGDDRVVSRQCSERQCYAWQLLWLHETLSNWGSGSLDITSMSSFRLVGSEGTSIDDQQRVDWVASSSGGTLLWSATRLLACLGWSGSTKDTQPFVGYRTQRKGPFKQLCDSYELDIDRHFLLST